MTGKDRERRLARERYERNLARRVDSRQRARKRNAVIGAVLGVVVVLGGTSTLAATLGFPGGGSGGEGAGAAGGANAPAGASPTASAAKASGCSYDRLTEKERTERAEFVGLPPAEPDPQAAGTATLHTNRGEIVIDLMSDQAPCTVNSFRFLAQQDFYSKTSCHRLVDQGIHVLQCGDPSGSGRGGPGYTFADENLDGARYPRGTVAMANSGPDTNGSQFFLVYQKGGLRPNYTPFGTIEKGLGVVDSVAAGGVAADGVAPEKKVVIEDIEITEAS